MLGQVGDSDSFAITGGGVAILRCYARRAARWSAVGMFEREASIFNVPIALIVLARVKKEGRMSWETYSKEFANNRIVWLHWFPFDVFLIACK